MAGQIISKVAAGGGTHLVAPSAYFVCDTAAATQAKIAKCADTNINAFVPVHGTTIAVRFVNSNTYNGTVTLTLQTNGGTQIFAAHNLYRYGTTNVGTDVTNSWNANSIVTLTYDTALNSSGYWIMNNWLNNNNTYNFSGTTFYSGNSGNAEHNANNAIKNGHYYYTSNGPATSLGASANDGALYVQSYSDTWVGQIAQDYRNGSLFVRGKNNGTWTSWKKVYDTNHKPTLTELDAAASNHTHSFTPAGTITVQSAGSTNSTLKPVTAKTMVKSGVFTKIGATAVSGSTLDLTDVLTAVSLATEDSVTLGNAVSVKVGDATYKFTGTAGTTGTPA